MACPPPACPSPCPPPPASRPPSPPSHHGRPRPPPHYGRPRPPPRCAQPSSSLSSSQRLGSLADPLSSSHLVLRSSGPSTVVLRQTSPPVDADLVVSAWQRPGAQPSLSSSHRLVRAEPHKLPWLAHPVPPLGPLASPLPLRVLRPPLETLVSSLRLSDVSVSPLTRLVFLRRCNSCNSSHGFFDFDPHALSCFSQGPAAPLAWQPATPRRPRLPAPAVGMSLGLSPAAGSQCEVAVRIVGQAPPVQ